MNALPVTFEQNYVERRSRLTTFFRLILAIPHYVVLSLWAIAASLVVIVAWFVLLFTARWPRGMFDFVAGFCRYATFVYAYVCLLTDEYPPFSGAEESTYPVRLTFAPPKPEYDRLKVLFRLFLAIPVAFINYAMQIVAQIGAFIAWFVIVVTGKQAQGLQDMTALGLSYQQRSLTYFVLLTEDWPPFTDNPATRITPA